jgi:hypothetical protein
MKAIFEMLNNERTVTTDELIADFEAASVCEDPDNPCGSPIHGVAADIAQRLRDYREWAGEEGDEDAPSYEEVWKRKEALMEDMRDFGATVELMALLQSVPVSGPAN